MAAHERIDEPFYTWVWRQWSFLVTSTVGIITLYLSWVRDYETAKPHVEWLRTNADLVIYLAQFAVATFLFMRLMFGPTPLACPSRDAQRHSEHAAEENGRRRRINRAVQRFGARWRWVWATWALFYFALAMGPQFGPQPARLTIDVHAGGSAPSAEGLGKTLNGEFRDTNWDSLLSDTTASQRTLRTADQRFISVTTHPTKFRDAHIPRYIYHAVLNGINNINGLAFLALYQIMIRRVRRQDRASRPSVLLFGGVAVIILAAWELIWAQYAAPDATNYFDVAAAAFASGVLILFFGRLAGQYIRPPGAIPPLLASYCVVQLAWPYFPQSTVVAAAAAAYALFMKIMLFYVVDYTLRSGDLIYYFDRVGDRSTPVVTNGPPDAWPELGQVQKRRQIERLLSDWRDLEPWGTDRE